MRSRFTFLALLGGFLLFLFLVAWWAPRKPAGDPEGRPSMSFTDATGGRAFYLLLQEILGPTSALPWSKPLDQLILPNKEGGSDTLIVQGATVPLDGLEAYHLDAWLVQGGQLILASDDGWTINEGGSLLESYHIAQRRTSGSTRTVRLDKGGLSLRTGDKVEWEGDFEVLAQSGDEVLAISVPVGEGRIIALADPAMLSNDSMRKADNGVWMLPLIAQWGDGKALFDEHHLGLGTSTSLNGTIRRFLLSPWGLAVLQGLLVGMLYLLLQGRRLGRPVLESPLAMNDPALLRLARAGLFRAAAARSLAISRFCHELAHHMKSPTGQPRDLGAMAAHSADVAELLALQERASQGKASDKDLLRAGQLAHKIREDN